MGGPETWREKRGPKLRLDHSQDVCATDPLSPEGQADFEASVRSLGPFDLSKPGKRAIPVRTPDAARPRSRAFTATTNFDPPTNQTYGDFYWKQPLVGTPFRLNAATFSGAKVIGMGPGSAYSSQLSGGIVPVMAASGAPPSRDTSIEFGGPERHWSKRPAPCIMPANLR